MSLYDQKQIRVGSVRCCPICGSTAIEVDILTSAVQNQDGEWTIAKVDSDELQYEVTHPSNQVRCLNPTCGDPYFGSSKLRLGELNLFQYFQLFSRIKQKQQDAETSNQGKANLGAGGRAGTGNEAAAASRDTRAQNVSAGV